MSEEKVQMKEQASDRGLREWIMAIIGLGIMLMYGIVALVATYAAVSGDSGGESFQQLKDLLTFLGGLVGTVVGYYFGRVGVEKRAEAAESTVQLTQEIQRKTEHQAAQALAKLDVEKLARDAAETGVKLAQKAQQEAEKVAVVAAEAREKAEVKIEQMGEVVSDITQGMQGVRERVETFKQELGEAGAAAAGLADLVLGAEGEGVELPPVDTAQLDDITADIDALLRKAEQVQH